MTSWWVSIDLHKVKTHYIPVFPSSKASVTIPKSTSTTNIAPDNSSEHLHNEKSNSIAGINAVTCENWFRKKREEDMEEEEEKRV